MNKNALVSGAIRGETGAEPAALREGDLSSPAATVADPQDQPEVAVLVPEAFAIDDEKKATWAVRKIAEARAYARRVEAWAAAELRRAEREEQWLLRRFERDLEAWLRAELQRRGGRRRSIALPGGTLGLRQQPRKLQVMDEPALAAWCETHLSAARRVVVQAEGRAGADLVRWYRRQGDQAVLKTLVLREPLMRYVEETGELPVGASLGGGDDRLYVK